MINNKSLTTHVDKDKKSQDAPSGIGGVNENRAGEDIKNLSTIAKLA